MKFGFKGHINNKQEIVSTKAWRQTDDKLSSEPMTMLFAETYLTTGMDKLITVQQLLRNYLKLNVHYVVAMKDFTISVTSLNNALFFNLRWPWRDITT